MNKKQYIISFAIATGMQFIFGMADLSAQQVSNKKFYSFERIEENAPWLLSGNGAGLIFNKVEHNFSQAVAYYGDEKGGYRNYNDAREQNVLGLNTKSYTSLNKKIFFYGNFNFEYRMKKDQTWLGTIEKNATLAHILENVPGKVVGEKYNLDAGIAYNTSDLFSLGLSVNYQTAFAAKRKDGRNKNTLSKLRLSPGIVFNMRYLNLGLNLNYCYNVEDVDYRYYGEVSDKKLYYLEGLFMYTSVNAGAKGALNNFRKYIENQYGASAQLELKLDKFTFYNQFSVGYGMFKNYEDIGESLSKHYSNTNSLDYNYLGILKYSSIKMDNFIKINFKSHEDAFYGIVNKYELIPGEKTFYAWYEYGKVLNYMSDFKTINIEYKGVIKRNQDFSNLDFSLGYICTNVDKKHKIFPAEYSQNFRINNVYANVNKSFLFQPNSFCTANINVSYQKGSGSALDEINALVGTAIAQKTDLLAADYAFTVSSNYTIGAGLKYSYIVDNAKGQTCWIKCDYLYKRLSGLADMPSNLRSLVGLTEKSSRNYLNISLGFNF